MIKRALSFGGLILLALVLAACTSRSPEATPGSQPTTSAPVRDVATAPGQVTPTTTAVPLQELPSPQNELTEQEYQWRQLLARDDILPIYQPEFAPAEEAPYEDDELVIGVEIDGQAKAYAIGPLNSREMVNDELAGIPILVTW